MKAGYLGVDCFSWKNTLQVSSLHNLPHKGRAQQPAQRPLNVGHAGGGDAASMAAWSCTTILIIIVALQAQTRNNSSRSLRCARENMQQDFGFVHFAKMDVEKCGALVDEGAGKIIFWGLDFLVHKSTCRHERGEIRQSVAILCRGVHKHGRVR